MSEFIVNEFGVPTTDRCLIRCKDCRYWQTGIAYDTVGRCTNGNMPDGLICNKNFFCGYGEAKA